MLLYLDPRVSDDYLFAECERQIALANGKRKEAAK